MSTIVWKRYIHSGGETIEAVEEKDPDSFFILLHNKRGVSRKVFDLKPFELELLNDTFLQDYRSIYFMKNKKC